MLDCVGDQDNIIYSNALSCYMAWWRFTVEIYCGDLLPHSQVSIDFARSSPAGDQDFDILRLKSSLHIDPKVESRQSHQKSLVNRVQNLLKVWYVKVFRQNISFFTKSTKFSRIHPNTIFHAKSQKQSMFHTSKKIPPITSNDPRNFKRRWFLSILSSAVTCSTWPMRWYGVLYICILISTCS